jgi:hypothetical protein
MTTKPKPVTLFGRRMRAVMDEYDEKWTYRFGNVYVLQQVIDGRWYGYDGMDVTPMYGSIHAAARALERKIESQWKRLGKLIGGEKA